MGIVVRQSIVTTVISYAGVLIGYVNLLYLYPRFLTPEQVGVMRTVQDAAILMAQFAQVGLAQSIIRFFPRFSGDESGGKNFINLILLAAVTAFGAFLLLFFIFESTILDYFRQNAQDFIHYIGLALWLTFITVITTMMEVYSRSLLKVILPNLLKEVVSRLLLAILVVCYFLNLLDFSQVMVFSVLIYLLCLLILVVALSFQGHLHLKLDLRPEPSFQKEFLRFGMLSFAGTAGLMVIGKVDSLMVAGLLGLTPVAIYTNSFYMATVIEIPKRAMTQIAAPLISRGFEKNDLTEIKTLYTKTALNQFIPGLLLLLGIAANIDSIFLLMPNGEIYQTGKWVVVIVGAGKLADMLFGPSSEIIVYSKYYAFNIVLIVILAIIIVTVNNLIIPTYGINGAAWSVALTLIIFNAVKFIFIWNRFHLQPFTFAFLKVILIGAAAWTINLVIPKLEITLLDMFVRSATITLVFGVLILWTRVSPESNDLFRKGLSLIGIKKTPF